MSGLLPQINEWDKQGLDWQYIDQSIMRVRELPANGQIQLPIAGYTFSYPEGVIIEFSGAFDHPKCGIRIESDPELDTDSFFTVETTMLGLTRPDNLVYGLVPPITPAGLYGIRIASPWVWKKWLRLYLINTDSIPHRIIGHSYHIAVLKEHRKVEVEKVIE